MLAMCFQNPKTVLERAQESPLSGTLRDRQMKLYRKISAVSEENLLKLFTCEPGTKLPRLWGRTRKRGRPKQQWASNVSYEREKTHCGTSQEKRWGKASRQRRGNCGPHQEKRWVASRHNRENSTISVVGVPPTPSHCRRWKKDSQTCQAYSCRSEGT